MDNEIKLEKKLSPVNVCSLALGCIIGWGAFIMPGNTFLAKAGPLGTFIAMAAAVVILTVIAFNYDYMINKYPVAGGPFKYTQEAFGNRHAFVCAWFLGLSYLAIVPLNGTALALIGRNLMGGIFQRGYLYTFAGYDIYLGEIILAIAALVGFAWMSIRGVKFTGSFQTLLVFGLVGGILVITAATLMNPDVSLEALKPAFNPHYTKLSGILAVIAVAPWAFVGFDTIPQAAEEFKFSHRKTKVIMVISIIFGGLVYVILNTVTAMVVPEGYSSWVDYIDAAPSLSGISSLPTFNAAYMMLGNFGLIFLGIAVLAAILSGIVGFYMAASRLLYSMANEEIIPKWFGKIGHKHKTPQNAIFFVMVISFIAPFFGRNALEWIVNMSSIGSAIGYIYTSAAAVKYARADGNKAIIFTGVAGLIIGIAFAVLILVPIPLFNCSLGRESYICLGIWILLGILFHIFSHKGK